MIIIAILGIIMAMPSCGGSGIDVDTRLLIETSDTIEVVVPVGVSRPKLEYDYYIDQKISYQKITVCKDTVIHLRYAARGIGSHYKQLYCEVHRVTHQADVRAAFRFADQTLFDYNPALEKTILKRSLDQYGIILPKNQDMIVLDLLYDQNFNKEEELKWLEEQNTNK